MSLEVNILFAGVEPKVVDIIRKYLHSDEVKETISRADDFTALKKKLRDSYDIVIIDTDVFPYDALEAIEYIRKFNGGTSLVLTAEKFGRDKTVKALEAGVSGIVIKENPERLIPVVKREAEIIQLQRKQHAAYHKILESEARYRGIFERTGTAKCIFSEDGTIRLANSQFEKLTGKEAAGKSNWMDMVLCEDRSKFQTIHDLIQSHKSYLPWKEAFRMVDSEGTMKYLIGTFSMIPETREHILSLVDVTGMKQVQEQLKVSEKRLAAAQKMARLGHWEWDIKPDRLTWSDEIYRIMEVEPGNFIPSLNSFLDLVHPEDRCKVRRAIRRSFSRKKPYSVEHRIKTPRQREKVLHERGDVIRDKQDNPVRMVGTVQDISERSRIQEQNRRLAAAVLNIREGILLFDSEKRILFVNPALEKILGFPRGELSGKSIDELGLLENLEKKSSSGDGGPREQSGRTTFRKPSGETIAIDVCLSPIKESNRSLDVDFTVLVLRDFTAEVRMEKHLRNSHKMEALGTLAGGITHDLNNILMPIVLNTELALWQVEDDEEIKDYLRQVLIAAKRGQELVNQVVSFSRQRPNEMKPIRVIPLMKEAIRLIRASAPAGIEINNRYLAENDLVFGNPTQIHQVLMNLCTNAVQAFTKERGKIDIILESIQLDAELVRRYPGLSTGRYLKLSVTDNGCGIPEENLDKIFDPFFTTKKSQEGSGMGLAVVNGIARKHQGAVNVYSEKEKGSTFNVFFPALDVDFQEMDEEDLDIPHGHEHIFIIDDEPALLKSLQQTLEKLEYKVSTQSSARRALEQFKMNPEKFDLILTDQTMPDLTGIELAEEIKKIKKDIPVILISGFNEKINDKELNKTGINQFLTKPVDTAKIAQSIRSVIDGSH